MADGLRQSNRREPLTWFRFDNGTIRVVCSRGHASTLQHIVLPDGSLVPPPGMLPSLHCGWAGCEEALPLRLAGWVPPPPT